MGLETAMKACLLVRGDRARVPSGAGERSVNRATIALAAFGPALVAAVTVMPAAAHALTASPIGFGQEVTGPFSTAKPAQWWKAQLRGGSTYAVAGGSGWCSTFTVHAPNGRIV